MRSSSKTLLFVVMSIFMIGMSSCHSSKKASYSGNMSLSATNDATTAILFQELADSYKPWSDLYVPVELSLESPKKISISGRATMIYGKEIYISLRMLGMEVGYVYINTDRVYVVDKFHKCYFSEDIGRLIKGYDVTVDDLQELLLGRAVLPGKGIVKGDYINDFTYLSTDEQWILSPVKAIDGADWHYIASRTDPPIVNALSMRVKGFGAMEFRFTEPTDTEAGVVDGVSTLTIPYKDSDIIVSITWMLSDARWDSGREVKFSEPSTYKRLDVENLLKSLSSDQ